MTRIAIVGAGLSGLILADRLRDLAQVTVFEKSRGPGGRMATRRAGPFAFDHGAQYFTARRGRFRQFLADHPAAASVTSWSARLVTLEEGRAPEPFEAGDDCLVPAPAMNALCKALSADMAVETGNEIISIGASRSGWKLIGKDAGGFGPFDWVISTAPAPQAAKLMPVGFRWFGRLDEPRMAGCFALMLGYDRPVDPGFDGGKARWSPVGWIGVNSEKPGREGATSVIVQSTNQWAEDNLDEDPALVEAVLLDEADRLTHDALAGPVHSALHRWRYAATPDPLGEPFLADEQQRLAVCGDWCLGSRVEDAYESASALADYLEERLY